MSRYVLWVAGFDVLLILFLAAYFVGLRHTSWFHVDNSQASADWAMRIVRIAAFLLATDLCLVLLVYSYLHLSLAFRWTPSILIGVATILMPEIIAWVLFSSAGAQAIHAHFGIMQRLPLMLIPLGWLLGTLLPVLIQR